MNKSYITTKDSSFELLNENLYNILQKLNRTKHKCFILGDFKF